LQKKLPIFLNGLTPSAIRKSPVQRKNIPTGDEVESNR